MVGFGRDRGAGSGLAYVVHRHEARRPHYDLRLELDGVLRSWALPRGPCPVAGEKRLAVEVEDHPLDYADFEGRIPEGRYGAGPVMIWDRGTWRPLGDPRRGLAAGKLDFELVGAKLAGRWHLVRMRRRRPGEAPHWLLIKGADAFARPPAAPDILEAEPRSVASGRSLDAIGFDDPADPPELPGPAPALRPTHPDRLYWPADGITKSMLADHLARVWPRMAPHVAGRPIALLRCPQGIDGPRFFQRHAWPGMDPAVRHAPDPRDPAGRSIVWIEDAGGLAALARAGAIEFHAWGARRDDLERPDRIVVDLDPGEGVAWERTVAAAREVRDRLGAAGLAAFVKTTGGRGLHVVAPLAPAAGWDAVTGFARGLARAMAADAPDRYVASPAKVRRAGRIFVDYLRNVRGATAVAPYSPRARPGAPVAMPVAWDELGPDLRPDRFSLADPPARIAATAADPWAGFEDAARPFVPAVRGF